jgi:spore maturation protein CgeB
MESKGDIVIVGVLDQPGSTNLYMAKAFEKAGYRVLPVNYRTILHNFGHKTLVNALYKLAADKPKLMLFSKCNGIPSLPIGRISGEMDVKTWFWFMDGINTLSRIPECYSHAQLSQYSSYTGLGVLNHVKKKINRSENMFHIMEGIDSEVYRPTMANEEFHCDIAFIGTANPERQHYLKTLAEAGYRVNAYGNGFGNEVNGIQFNMACSGAKAMLALSAEYNTDEYFSDRVFRYGACAALVMHKYAPGLKKYFTHGQDILFFENEQNLLEHMDYFIKQNRVEDIKAMKENIYNKVLERHTWDNVVAQICSAAQI